MWPSLFFSLLISRLWTDFLLFIYLFSFWSDDSCSRWDLYSSLRAFFFASQVIYSNLSSPVFYHHTSTSADPIGSRVTAPNMGLAEGNHADVQAPSTSGRAALDTIFFESLLNYCSSQSWIACRGFKQTPKMSQNNEPKGFLSAGAGCRCWERRCDVAMWRRCLGVSRLAALFLVSSRRFDSFRESTEVGSAFWSSTWRIVCLVSPPPHASATQRKRLHCLHRITQLL